MSALHEVFDLEPITSVEVVAPDGTSTVVVPDGDAETDHSYARAKTYEVLERGSAALALALRIAEGSENPRAIEVMSGLMKNISDISKNLVTLNKDKNEARTSKKNTSAAPTIGTQNVVFAGSSADLNKLLSGK